VQFSKYVQLLDKYDIMQNNNAAAKLATHLQSFHSMTPRQSCKPARFCEICSHSRNLKTPYLAVG